METRSVDFRQSISYEVSVPHCVAHSDLNELMNALLPMAEMLLTKQGQFYPIGAITLSDGEIRHVGAKIEGDAIRHRSR